MLVRPKGGKTSHERAKRPCSIQQRHEWSRFISRPIATLPSFLAESTIHSVSAAAKIVLDFGCPRQPYAVQACVVPRAAAAPGARHHLQHWALARAPTTGVLDHLD